MTHSSLLLLAVSLSVALPGTSLGEDRFLFIGNSFTYADGGTASVPEIFRRLAVAGGHGNPLVSMRAVGGQNFQFHENDPTTRDMIASQPWTWVILQNYSTEPTHIGNVANHLTYGNALDNRVLANNAATRVMLYQTWSRSAVHPLISGVSTPTTFASTDEMQSELRANYQLLADSLNTAHPEAASVGIAPVGDAWQNVGGLLAPTDPSYIRVHGTDDYHGNDNGYFISAAVFYSRIYGQSPEGLHTQPLVSSLNLKLTADPNFLEQVAWKTAQGTLEVRYVGQPASLNRNEHQSATFTAKALGSQPFTVQWFRNGEPIANANELTYTVPDATLDLNGSVYTVSVTNAVSSLTSDPATLSVAADTTPPAAVAEPVLDNAQSVTLSFSEALSDATASNPSSYTVIFHGERIPVSTATPSADGTKVTLSLASPIQNGFSVGIGQGITDLSGNAVAAGMIHISHASAPTPARTFLFDFGTNENGTGPGNDAGRNWNNIGTTIGTTNNGVLNSLIDTTGAASTLRLEMVRRFNAVNTNGTTASMLYPSSATFDSLYGNTEAFNGLSNILPAFRLTGLDPATSYSLTFYASRTGVSDTRETLYTVTGAQAKTTTLNVANNISTQTTISDLAPAADGTLLIELTPTANNNNANHFTYLGVMSLSPSASAATGFYPPAMIGRQLVLEWHGSAQLETSPDLSSPWTPVTPAPTPPYTETIGEAARFYRLSTTAP